MKVNNLFANSFVKTWLNFYFTATKIPVMLYTVTLLNCLEPDYFSCGTLNLVRCVLSLLKEGIFLIAILKALTVKAIFSLLEH